MTPQEVAAATATPIGALGRSYFAAGAVTEAMEAAGFEGLPRYVGGRGGVLGDVAAGVVVSGFALFHPAMIRKAWDQTREQGSPPDAAAALATGIGRWAVDTFGHLDGLGDFAAAARTVFDATEPMSQALYAGWRAMPVPEGEAEAAGLALQILRELRFGFHVHALSAVGMTPVEAIIARANPQQARFFGWSEPFPDPEPLVIAHQRAEEITSARMSEAYEAIDTDQRAHMATTVAAIATTALAQS
ncbi:helix-turn-helix domain-containing protein [Candidatus Poriferisocius sp.]|uniref:helix-turn-helix domain-containing protein n=1 Tax=Candidatus Poriferisocius sp. TaxID=3101276 RepID=UPI003B01CB71